MNVAASRTEGLWLLCGTLVLLGLAVPSVAQAQVELVVRLHEDATGALARELRPAANQASVQSNAAADTVLVALRQEVQQTRSVFRQPAVAGAGVSAGEAAVRREQPIPAYVLQLPDSAALERVRTLLDDNREVAYVQENHHYHIKRNPAHATPDAPDPLLDSLRYFSVIRAPQAHEVTQGKETVRVGVVDTGIFLQHPDLQGQLWINPGEDVNGNGRADAADFNGMDDDDNGFVDDVQGYDFVDRPEVLYTGDYADRDPDPSHDRLEPASPLGNPHGTNVGGIIAAASNNGEGIAGVAPGTRLVPLRAFGGDGSGSDVDIAAAIVYAADMGIEVLNFSFGDVYYSRLMEEAVRYAAQRGVVMVASAGNNAAGQLQREHYPSDYPEVISVAQLAVKIDVDGGLVLSIPGRYGTGLDLSAPGTQIFTTTLPRGLLGGGEDAASLDFYTRADGSSFAAPQVAATAALLRSLDATLSPEAIRAILTATAEDLEEEGWDHRTGAGLLDAGTAVRRALPARTALTWPESDSGIQADQVAVVGSSLDPSFRSYSVYYARGDTIGFAEDDLVFKRIAGPVAEQALDDTLAVWKTGALPEGLYTLRLATRLQDGTTVEERRRVHIDRSPPQIHLRLLDKGMIGDQVGVLVDVQTDDLSTASMKVRGHQTHSVVSDRRARRHGLTWASPSGDGGPVQVEVQVTNVAGLITTVERALRLPQSHLNSALFEERELDVPAGLLLPKDTDFDGDGLSEISLAEYGPRAAYTDTLRTYEWAGADFRPAHTLLTNLLPRDTGDTDGDGLQEMLMQIGGASVLIEQPASSAYPTFSQIAFADTSEGEADSTHINGALLTDMDSDGQGEVLGYDRGMWRLVEAQDGGGYQPVATLVNPTEARDDEYDPAFENSYGVGRAATGDFDGDGRRGLLAVDNGGDFVLYEARGNDRYQVTWKHQTPRYAGAGRRVCAGDFDGDGTEEFVTYTRPVVGVNSDVEREPLFGRYYLWRSMGDDRYQLADSLSIQGVTFSNTGLADGAVTAADFDGDGRDELAVLDPPALYVFRYEEQAGLVPIYHRGITSPPAADHPRSNGLESPAVVVADFDGNGAPELISSAADGRLHRFAFQRSAHVAPPPRWVRAVAPNAGSAQLQWRAPGADSVLVFRAEPGTAFDPYATVRRDSVFLDTLTEPHRYTLRAYYGRKESPLSDVRTVRPEPSPTVAEVAYPSPHHVRLRFTRRLGREARTDQFVFVEGGTGREHTPRGLVLAEHGRTLVLRFAAVAGTQGTLRWQGLRSARGVPVAQSSVALAFPKASGGTLIVRDWTILDGHRVALVFNAPLQPAFAADSGNYSVTAPGTVAAVDYDKSEPARVVIRLSSIRIGATGQEHALTVEEMRGQRGESLAEEGHTVRLSQAAQDLHGVYVYPNPYHAGRHAEERITVAGLPSEATVKILSVQGTLVRTLRERGSDGGLDWDLRDGTGLHVPSGVYFVHVNAPDADPVLKKAAVIR